MSIPHLLNPLPALLAAAITIPALLILYFLKLRRREQLVPSTFLWKKAIQDLQVNAPFQRLRRNLLLLLQVLLLIFLIIALARPITNYRPGAGKLTVILIDRSASMSSADIDGGKRTRLDEAKQRAKELVDSMGRNASAMVIAFDDTAKTVQPWTTDTASLRQAIDAVQPTDRRSRLKLAYQLAEAQTNFNPDQLRPNEANRPDVRLYSDGRVLDDGTELSVRGNLIFERIGSDTAPNVGIVALSARRNYERPAQVQVFARLANYGPEPVEVPVQLSVDGEVVALGGTQVRNTYLLPERWTREQRDKYDADNGKAPVDSVDFQIDLTNAAVIKVEQMRKEGDVLPADDVAQVVVPAPKTLSVLLVTEGNYFLEKAINSLGLSKPAVMRPEAYEQKLPNEFDVILFDRYKPKKRPPAGSFIYLIDGAKPALPDDLKIKIAKDTNGNPIVLKDVGVLDWKRDHPILRNLAMSKLYVAEAAKLDLPPEAEVLLDGLKGPLIVLSRQSSTHLVIAFDVLQSNWPLKVSFPIFLHNALQFLAIGSDMDVRQSFPPGSTPLIPRTSLQKLDPALQKFRLKGPGSPIDVAIPESGDAALPPLDRAGLYTTDPPIPQFEQMAVNLLDANESNILPVTKPPGGDNAAVTETVKETRSRLELWWWIAACLVLPLLMVEWYVYTRRVHL